jgi:hypothetical protein
MPIEPIAGRLVKNGARMEVDVSLGVSVLLLHAIKVWNPAISLTR